MYVRNPLRVLSRPVYEEPIRHLRAVAEAHHRLGDAARPRRTGADGRQFPEDRSREARPRQQSRRWHPDLEWRPLAMAAPRDGAAVPASGNPRPTSPRWRAPPTRSPHAGARTAAGVRAVDEDMTDVTFDVIARTMLTGRRAGRSRDDEDGGLRLPDQKLVGTRVGAAEAADVAAASRHLADASRGAADAGRGRRYRLAPPGRGRGGRRSARPLAGRTQSRDGRGDGRRACRQQPADAARSRTRDDGAGAYLDALSAGAGAGVAGSRARRGDGGGRQRPHRSRARLAPRRHRARHQGGHAALSPGAGARADAVDGH